ncbi:P-loop containing nucleoside triphosphate hydrolase protein [Rhizophagus clarus]|uniref:P-loop containing nucleoside triphosphate hydrolase protein n=1 Tax=Rhizophagus clarus TaxID=94130 RepID=A0A8H3MAB5_9GLOM|nr:P-loop containing nucleoside triphosphate hydrolase protein [Rhizophagus clarus]
MNGYDDQPLIEQFNDICKITGTRMSYIDRYVRDYKLGEGFSFYQQEYIKMRKGLNPKGVKSKSKNCYESFSRSRKPRIYSEDDLIKEIGYKAVHSLVNYRFLYRRPNLGLNKDIKYPPADSKVMMITPTSQIIAVKELLKKYKH